MDTLLGEVVVTGTRSNFSIDLPAVRSPPALSPTPVSLNLSGYATAQSLQRSATAAAPAPRRAPRRAPPRRKTKPAKPKPRRRPPPKKPDVPIRKTPMPKPRILPMLARAMSALSLLFTPSELGDSSLGYTKFARPPTKGSNLFPLFVLDGNRDEKRSAALPDSALRTRTIEYSPTIATPELAVDQVALVAPALHPGASPVSGPAARNVTSVRPAATPVARPVVSPLSLPGLMPFPASAPGLLLDTLPTPQPRISPSPKLSLGTLALPTPQPVPKEDTQCKCKEPKKKRRKPSDREVCYRGTFTERKRGLNKVRKERVPCQ